MELLRRARSRRLGVMLGNLDSFLVSEDAPKTSINVSIRLFRGFNGE